MVEDDQSHIGTRLMDEGHEKEEGHEEEQTAADEGRVDHHGDRMVPAKNVGPP